MLAVRVSLTQGILGQDTIANVSNALVARDGAVSVRRARGWIWDGALTLWSNGTYRRMGLITYRHWMGVPVPDDICSVRGQVEVGSIDVVGMRGTNSKGKREREARGDLRRLMRCILGE